MVTFGFGKWRKHETIRVNPVSLHVNTSTTTGLDNVVILMTVFDDVTFLDVSRLSLK